MARVTVEDCLQHVENRFVLVLEAAERAHQLELSGAEPKVPPDNDKPTVIALREIAAGYHFSEEGVKATLKAPVNPSATQVSKDLLGESVE